MRWLLDRFANRKLVDVAQRHLISMQRKKRRFLQEWAYRGVEGRGQISVGILGDKNKAEYALHSALVYCEEEDAREKERVRQENGMEMKR